MLSDQISRFSDMKSGVRRMPSSDGTAAYPRLRFASVSLTSDVSGAAAPARPSRAAGDGDAAAEYSFDVENVVIEALRIRRIRAERAKKEMKERAEAERNRKAREAKETEVLRKVAAAKIATTKVAPVPVATPTPVARPVDPNTTSAVTVAPVPVRVLSSSELDPSAQVVQVQVVPTTVKVAPSGSVSVKPVPVLVKTPAPVVTRVAKPAVAQPIARPVAQPVTVQTAARVSSQPVRAKPVEQKSADVRPNAKPPRPVDARMVNHRAQVVKTFQNIVRCNDEAKSRQLLQLFKWNISQAIKAFYDHKGNIDEILAKNEHLGTAQTPTSLDRARSWSSNEPV